MRYAIRVLVPVLALFLVPGAFASEPETRQCTVLPPTQSGLCDYAPGDSALLIRADVLAPSGVLLGGEVLIGSDGRIACTACDCSADPAFASASVLSCPEATVSPGLIDADNSLDWADSAYADHGTERYEHRHDWRRGQNGHTRLSISRTDEAELWGEIRALISGTTSIASSSAGVDNLVRNLTRADQLDGIEAPAWDRDTFPLGDADGSSLTSGCDYNTLPTPDPAQLLHANVAEGIDERAANEFRCLSDKDGSRAGVNAIPKSTIAQGITLNGLDAGQMALAETSLVWTPRNDISLYGLTAPVTTMETVGINVLLGTRWRPTGSMNLLHELSCAVEFNESYLDNRLSAQQLFNMTTINAARAAGMDDDIGSLARGSLADLVLFESRALQGHEVVTRANEAHVSLVLKGGQALYGDASLMDFLGRVAPDCEAVSICGETRTICMQGETGSSLPGTFTTPLAYCGVSPVGERTCTPSREGAIPLFTGATGNGDVDGDGVADADDNCPSVFNPPLPRGNRQQDDADQDGIGDVCDSSPIPSGILGIFSSGFEDANFVGGTASGVAGQGLVVSLNGAETLFLGGSGTFDFATVLEPGTEWVVTVDGSPPGQICTASSNTGVMANSDIVSVLVECEFDFKTVYEVKQALVSGDVALQNLLVTACATGTGFWVQTVPGDPDFAGTDYSGVFVDEPASQCGIDISVGDRVDLLPASVDESSFRIQLVSPTTIVRSQANDLPAPVDVDAASVGGFLPVALEGVLVKTSDVTVTDDAPAPGPGDTNPSNEFEVNDGLRVDDLIHLVNPFPVDSDFYASITGVLFYANNHMKLLPRDADDLLPGVSLPIEIASLAPDPASVLPSASVNLTVELTKPASSGGVDVQLSLVPGTFGTVAPSVTVGAGLLSAQFSFNAGSVEGVESLTATLGDSDVSVTINIAEPVAGLVINELDYDQSGQDLMEFVELFNAGATEISLADLVLVMVNGSTSTEYARYALSNAGSSLAAGQYLVIGSTPLIGQTADGALTMGLTQDTGVIQNGAPDGLLILNTSDNRVLDVLSYEGAITAATVVGVSGTVNLVEGTAASAEDPGDGSLARSPNGSDTGNGDADWSTLDTSTPGASND